MDLAITYNAEKKYYDYTVVDGDLAIDNGLESMVQMSLLTDARTEESEVDDPDDRRGWWGDLTERKDFRMGSKLWLLKRSKILRQTPAQAQGYIYSALKWMIEEGIARKIEVSATIAGNPPTMRLEYTVRIYKRVGGFEDFEFSSLWKSQLEKG